RKVSTSWLVSLAMPSSSLQNKESPALKRGDAEPAPLGAGFPRLYSHRFCPFSQRIQIYLEKKEIRREIVNVNVVNSKPEWYFNKNQKGSVPTFELDGKVLFESLIVCEYLDDIFPSTSILSTDPYTRARQKILVEQLSVVQGGFSAIFIALKSGKTDADVREAIEKFTSALNDCEKVAESDAPFFAGSAPGFPDYMIFPYFDRVWAMATGVVPELRPALVDDVKQFTVSDFPGSDTWPRLTRWFDAVQRLEEIKASRQPHDSQVAFLKTYVSGAPDYDIGI
ncbi:hypothetical protein PENTCL1PPCAC_16329, partial [Pristionchus entomophagus]